MKPARDGSAYRSIKDFGDDFSGFLAQPPEYVFTHGACHAFALELRDLLKQQGTREAKLCMIRDSPLLPCDDVVDAPSAKHIYVLTPKGCIDINGIQPESCLIEDWKKKNPEDTVKYEREVREDWLVEPGPNEKSKSAVGLLVDVSFLSAARILASKIIRQDPAKFGLA